MGGGARSGLAGASSRHDQGWVAGFGGTAVCLRVSVSKSLNFVVSDISDGNSRVKCFIRTQAPRHRGRGAEREPKALSPSTHLA